jgi:alanine racemase
MTRPVGPHNQVRVDLSAVRHNVRVLALRAPDSEVMAVVKADAYNHGAVEVARAALEAGAREIGVTTLHEALVLRDGGVTAPVLCWLHGPGTDFALAVDRDVHVAVSHPEQLRSLMAVARESRRVAQVSVKVDTGLARNGAGLEQLAAMASELADGVDHGHVVFSDLFTHLSHADEPKHPSLDRQRDLLLEARQVLSSRGVTPRRLHAANSAASLTRPDLHFDMVRPGLAVYGLNPVPQAGGFDLRPAMTWETEVALVKTLEEGDGVSYSHQWHAPAGTDVALIPAGYADGVPRHGSGRISVLINGRRFPSVGRICMDQFMVDLGSGGHGVSVGQRAVLFGPGTGGEMTAQDWSEAIDTIPYEIVTRVGQRARRHIIDPPSPARGGGTA